MPVYELLYSMTHEEYTKWHLYFEQRPIGWRDDERTMRLLQAQGVEVKPEEVFQSLRAMSNFVRSEKLAKATKNAEYQLDLSTLKGSNMFMLMNSAKGGVKLGE